jgi:3-oxoadipate enol-lactonase
MPASFRLLSANPRIAVNISGSGEAVIFLHGVGTTRSSWDAQLAHFHATHFAVAWDARGYGDSDDYDGDLNFAVDFSGDLANVLDELNIQTAHIVGLSMGGFIAQCFYFAHPQRVATLTLAHTFPSFRALGDTFVDQFVATRFQPLLDGGTPADAADATVKGLLGPRASEAARRHFHTSLCALRRDSYIKALRGLLQQGAPGVLEDITVPTLLLTGDHDRLAPPPVSRDMAHRIAGSEIMIIPDCGHLSNIERPDEFNRILRDFVSRHGGIATRRTGSAVS